LRPSPKGKLQPTDKKQMNSLRLASLETVPQSNGCCRCLEANYRWDRIAGQAYCPNCQELLAQGEAEPLVLATEKKPCAVCNRVGTVCYLTYPLEAKAPIEMELCPEHLRALIGRRLTPPAFHQLRGQLADLGLEVEEIFLLHGAFYDSKGRAFLPALELD
jgi:hypothetical protein